MNIDEACKILGVNGNENIKEIKTKYRELIFKYHPDSPDINDSRKAQLINEAYTSLKSNYKLSKNRNRGYNSSPTHKAESRHHFNGKDLSLAYCNRNVYERADINVINNDSFINIARGKFLWEPDKEDFDCFIHSCLVEVTSLLESVELALDSKGIEYDTLKIKPFFQMQLFNSFAMSFINPVFSLRKILKANAKLDNNDRIYEIHANLSTVGVDDYYKRLYALKPGTMLYPTKLKNNRLTVSNNLGQSLGNLSIKDDRLLYIVIPILKRKLATVRIVVNSIDNNRAKKPYRINVNISLFIKLTSEVLEREIQIEHFNEITKEHAKAIESLLNEYENALIN
jgi:curved DNA-binding protein CbpA